MWLFVMFDLPTVTAAEKRAQTVFRNMLLRRGFVRLQWSVYARSYSRDRASDPERRAIELAVPRGGRVRLLAVTDLQFEKMICLDGARRVQPERKMEQVVMFD
jgi:CRISPR-associated protein Cas2